MAAKVFTEAQAAKQLDVSEGTLARWRRTRYIRHWRQFGRLVKYTPEDIENILADRRAMKPTPVTTTSVSEARFG